MRVLSQVAIRPHVLQFPPASMAARFRQVAERMLVWGGTTWQGSSRDRARAVVGWFAAHAVHPQAFLHPDGSTANVGVLPTGETWASFNAIFNSGATITRDQAYWYSLFPDGVTMLERLIGTVESNGTVTDNGMLGEVTPGVWRIRNLADYRAPQCTLQCKMAQVILASMGILAIDISTAGHDPMAFYDTEVARWFYIDPTFGEMLTIAGEFQGPLDLLQTSLGGRTGTIASSKLPGAGYIPVSYFTSPAYPSGGMSFMTIHTAPQWAGGLSDRLPYRFGSLPSLSPANDRVGTIAQLLPPLGVAIGGLSRDGDVIEARLRSSWPEHVGYQRSNDGGMTWAACDSTEYLTPGSANVQFRSVNAEPFAGTLAIIDT